MKEFLLLLLSVLIIPISHAQGDEVLDYTFYHQFTEGEVYYTLGDHVNIRESASPDANKTGNLTINMPVTILENTKTFSTINGWEFEWCKISYQENGVKKTGYIWGGLLATKRIRSKTDEALFFLFGPQKKIITKEGDEKLQAQVRAVLNGEEISKLEFPAIGGDGMGIGFFSLGKKAVPGIKEVLGVYFSGNSCGAAFGEQVIYWDGKKLMHVWTLNDGADSGEYYDERLVYPDDEKGKPGIIIFVQESGYYDNNTNKDVIESLKKHSYKWDGTKLVKQ